MTMKIITPPQYLGGLMKLIYDHEGEILSTDNFGDNRTLLTLQMPLRELMRNFFDEVKSVSSGYASISYDITESGPADVVRMDILVADEPVAAFARIVSRRRAEEEAEKPSSVSTTSCRASSSPIRSRPKLSAASYPRARYPARRKTPPPRSPEAISPAR